ncbi:MAG: response regulator transcription factor [Clostridia bacterium]|nr:response regulator transcription factor [Clostridia bacterium]
MPYSLTIVDDAPDVRALLRSLSAEWAERRGVTLRICEYESAEDYLFSGVTEDILLLDIEMKALSGVDLAKQLRRKNDAVQIIFVTGYSDYIAEGYEVAALNYLMKPVQREKLFATLDRAAERLARDEKTLVLETADGVVRVPLRQIRYADVQGNYVTVHAREDYVVRRTMAELAASLDERFHRLGRSVIVNLTCVRRVSRREVILEDGTAIPLPRGAYEAVNRAIINMK